MKKRSIVCLLMLFLGFSLIIPVAQSKDFSKPLANPLLDLIVQPLLIPYGLINWKVGDFSDYDMSLGAFGRGTVHKEVTEEVDAGGEKAVWLIVDAKMMLGNQKMEMLYRRSDGKVLKMLVNGNPQEYSEPDIEILDQKSNQTLEIPNFRTFHNVFYIKLKEKKQNAVVETWLQLQEIPIDGSAKAIITKGLTITMTITAMGNKLTPRTSE